MSTVSLEVVVAGFDDVVATVISTPASAADTWYKFSINITWISFNSASEREIMKASVEMKVFWLKQEKFF